ncbi:uncharacterized protein TNCV_4917111 [Trichonephila clavipes]|nr:uncharacterized protein TNCV_4917111 [Trichonephila clavipes]
MIEEVNALVLDDSRIVMDEIHRLLGISGGNIHTIILKLQKNLCAVDPQPNDHRTAQYSNPIVLSLSHLQHYPEEEYAFLSQNVTGDVTWVTILNPKASIRASSGNMRLHHLQRNLRPCTPVLVRS